MFKALWGMGGALESQLDSILEAGYVGIETPLPDDAQGFGRVVARRGLRLVVQAFPLSVAELEHALARAVEAGAEKLNVHSGRDWWSRQQGLDYFGAAVELAAGSPIPLLHETHRGRLLYSAASTADTLQAVPELRITADFSHWTCVSESLLEDQQAAVELAASRTAHLHARVGHEEGPQVSDPRAPEWSRQVARFEEMWDLVRERCGLEELTVVPEFGPPNYMPTQPYTGMPVADLWDVCLSMKTRLERRWDASAAEAR